MLRGMRDLFPAGEEEGLFGKQKKAPSTYKKKTELIDELSRLLAFADANQFDTWFRSLSSLQQYVIWKGCWHHWLFVENLEKEFQLKLVNREKRPYHYGSVDQFLPEAGLDFLSTDMLERYDVTRLPEVMRIACHPWLAPPSEVLLVNCRLPEDNLPPPETIYDNSQALAESLPLLCDALRQELKDMDDTALDRFGKGVPKTTLKRLAAATAWREFFLPAGDSSPSSLDMAARFIALMSRGKPPKIADPYEGLRKLIGQFFADTSAYSRMWRAPDREALEACMLVDHLSNIPGRYLDIDNTLPVSRSLFKIALEYIYQAENQTSGWFNAIKLAEWNSTACLLPFSFCEGYQYSYRLNADSVRIEGNLYTSDYNGITPHDFFAVDLYEKPLFKAYCCLFAALGLLEIAQYDPPKQRTRNNKELPISPYDSLAALRLTDLGKWCLGYSDKKPALPENQYEAIADRELLLVTMKGKSLQRKLFLDQIGEKLGELKNGDGDESVVTRWRVTPESFIREALSKDEIQERVKRFKALIDPKPAPHWKALFDTVLSRAGVFDGAQVPLLVYKLPDDHALVKELLADPAIRKLTQRAEGGLLLVTSANKGKFFKALAAHGVASFG
jgi:hypothetical protein